MKKRLIKLIKTSVKLALLGGLAVGGWYAYRIYMPTEEDDGLGELPTAIVAVRDITVSVEATGVLRPIKIVEIKSKASGEILEMPVEVGDFIEAGDLIAQVDTKILDQELKQVQANYESAVVGLDIGRNQYERAQTLFEQDLISANDLEFSQQDFSNARGQLLRAEATLDLAKERLADATVRAPSAGTILNKTVEEGQIIASSTNNVSGGTILVQMADLSRLEIRTLVDEVDIGQVHPGLSVESKVEALADERFLGEVMKIEPQAVVQQSVTTFPVLSQIDNTDGKLLPGMNADVSIVVRRKPGVLTVPNEAVRTPSDAMEVKRMLGLNLSGDDGFGGGDFGRGRGDIGGAGRGDVGARGDFGNHGGSGDRGGRGERGSSGGDRGQGSGRGDFSTQRGSFDGGGRGGGGRSGGDRGGGGRGGGGDRGSGGGGSGAGDTRARFASASPADRQRMMAAFREAANAPDRDPFGLDGRREDAVVFVYDELGQITTKDIVVGLRDWENTEVLEGLEPGEEVLLLPSTSLLRSQDRLRSWAQGRSGIPGLGGGGGRPPRMGRGGPGGGGRGGRGQGG